MVLCEVSVDSDQQAAAKGRPCEPARYRRPALDRLRQAGTSQSLKVVGAGRAVVAARPQAALLESGAPIRTGRGRCVRAFLPGPSSHGRAAVHASRAARTGIPYGVCCSARKRGELSSSSKSRMMTPPSTPTEGAELLSRAARVAQGARGKRCAVTVDSGRRRALDRHAGGRGAPRCPLRRRPERVRRRIHQGSR
jgi:hypothetical protein